jgi:hypothetical protein
MPDEYAHPKIIFSRPQPENEAVRDADCVVR